jgi:hypothetical protein
MSWEDDRIRPRSNLLPFAFITGHIYEYILERALLEAVRVALLRLEAVAIVDNVVSRVQQLVKLPANQTPNTRSTRIAVNVDRLMFDRRKFKAHWKKVL